MKGYLTLCFAALAFCTVSFLCGCSESSGWGAGYQGMQLQQDGRPSVPAGSAPDGSGAVDYVPQGNY